MKLYRVLLLMFTLTIAVIPHAAAAQEQDTSGARIQLGGHVTVDSDEVITFLLSIDADVIIDGRIGDSVVLISSNSLINGRIEGDILALGGTVRLGPSAVVTGDVIYNNTTFITEPGAVVQGSERDDLGVDFGRDITRWVAWIALANWAGTTFLALLAGVVFAGIGGRQLWGSAAMITSKPLQSILLIVLLSIVVVMLAGLLFVSVIGIPVGIVLLLVLAVIWALGYIVAGARIGAALTRRRIAETSEAHPYVPTLVGITVIQILAFVPVIVSLMLAYAAIEETTRVSPVSAIALIAYWSFSAVIWLIGLLGAGGLCYYAWRAWTSPGPNRPPV